MSKMIWISLSLHCLGSFYQVQSYPKTPPGAKTTAQAIDVAVAFSSPSTVQVSKIPVGSSSDMKSLAVTKEPAEIFEESATNTESIHLMSDAWQAEANSSTGEITFYDVTVRALSKDKAYVTLFIPYDDADTYSYNDRLAYL